MQNPTYLIRSEHAVFHFRWPMPLHMMPDNKRRYVKVSLNTREPKEALYLSKLLSYHADAITIQAWARGMRYQEIRAIVREYFQRSLASGKQRIMEGGLLSPKELAYYQKHSTIEDAQSWDDMDLYESGIASMLKGAQLDISKDSDDYQHFRKAYVTAVPAMAKEMLRFNEEQSRFDFSPSNHRSDALPRLNKLRQTGMDTLAKAVDKFIAAHVNDKVWDGNTKKDQQAKLTVLMEILGKDYLVADMDLHRALEVRDIVKQLPKNLNKNPLLAKLSLMDAIKMKDAERLSARTAQKYVNCYSNLFQWCITEGVITSNPFANVKANVGRKKEQPKRWPFNAEQIAMIRKAALAEDKHYRRWGTLLGMYTGARINEVAQLMLDDIKQKEGIWYFDMNDEGEGKKLKTSASRRMVPIHKALLELGIIEEAERLRKQGYDRFLHELTHDEKNGYGKKLSHYFNEVLLVKLGIKRKELVFHSFRHTANTCLHQAEVSDSVVQTIIGHQRSGVSQQTYFEEGYTIQTLKEAMDKFDPLKIVINR